MQPVMAARNHESSSLGQNLATNLSQPSNPGNRIELTVKDMNARFMNGPRTDMKLKANTKNNMRKRSGNLDTQNRKISDFFTSKTSISVDPTSNQGQMRKS